ncbi:DDE-type integrase/transposase/recombinase [Acidisoma sp. 7E03]
MPHHVSSWLVPCALRLGPAHPGNPRPAYVGRATSNPQRTCGLTHYLWRAVDQTGTVLNILVQKRRDTEAANRFFRKLVKGQVEAPRVIVTDKLKSYAAAKGEILPKVEHRQSRYLNNRAEVSHQPTRRR